MFMFWNKLRFLWQNSCAKAFPENRKLRGEREKERIALEGSSCHLSHQVAFFSPHSGAVRNSHAIKGDGKSVLSEVVMLCLSDGPGLGKRKFI